MLQVWGEPRYSNNNSRGNPRLASRIEGWQIFSLHYEYSQTSPQAIK
jgi:hypothetical protein